MWERLEALGKQLAEYVVAPRSEHQEQYQEVEVLKGSLKEVETLLETPQSMTAAFRTTEVPQRPRPRVF